MEVTLLGTGTSTGIPVIGCECRVCSSTDPRDNRTRCACLVEVGDMKIVIDTGPDFRRQAMREDLRRIDAVLYTHHHFDHVAGIDDLRPFLFDNATPIPCYAQAETVHVLEACHPYIFDGPRYPGAPRLTLREIDGPFEIPSRYDSRQTIAVEPVDVWHGDQRICGYRIGDFAYLTDTSDIPEESFEQLTDLDILVLDALRYREHHSHLSVNEAVRATRRINPRKAYFIHMTHDLLHAEVEDELPPDIHLAYDGLRLSVNSSS